MDGAWPTVELRVCSRMILIVKRMWSYTYDNKSYAVSFRFCIWTSSFNLDIVLNPPHTSIATCILN